MKRCERRESIQNWLDGEMPEAESRAFEAHVAQCRECAAEIQAFRAVFALAASLPLVEPPVRLTERVLDRALPSRLRRRAWARRVGWTYAGAVAACLTVALVWVLGFNGLQSLGTLGALASHRVVQIFVFTLNAGSEAVFGVMRGWTLLTSAGSYLAPFVRALATVATHSRVTLALWPAALACVALLWWLRPRRRRDGGMRHVAILGF
jgi:anti-sigma factor RsiW